MTTVPGINFAKGQASWVPTEATSDDILAGLQDTYGAQKYTSQSVLRYEYYSGFTYPLAGANSLAFFSQNQSQIGTYLTNIELANSTSTYSYLITAISFDLQVYQPTTANNAPWSYALDTDCPYPDIVHGLTQGGVSNFSIDGTSWDQVDLPFQFAPACIGKNRMETSMSALAITQAGMSPFATTNAGTNLCFADVERRSWRRRYLKNRIFLAPQTSFKLTIDYPSGAIPVIGTTLTTNGATPPTAGALIPFARLDGYRYAPVS